MDAMLIILPERCFIIKGEIVLQRLNTPVKLIERTRSQSSFFILIKRPSFVMPALLTRRSIRPMTLTASSTDFSTSFRSETFVLSARVFTPRLSTSFAVCVASSRLISEIIMLAPSLARAKAMALPMPCAAPVINATLSFNFVISFYLHISVYFLDQARKNLSRPDFDKSRYSIPSHFPHRILPKHRRSNLFDQ